MKRRSPFTPRGWHTVTPRLIAHDSEKLVEFLRQVFDAGGTYRRDLPSEMTIGDSRLMVSESGIRPPMTGCLYVYVDSVEATYQRAMAAGARSLEEPSDQPYGDRRAMFEDHWGNTWQVASRLKRSLQRRRAPKRSK